MLLPDYSRDSLLDNDLISGEYSVKVSVLIPAYNCAAFIRMTLDSVLMQSFPPYEILVMDDGSTDDTLSVLNTYKSKIKIFRGQNQGVANARNFLFQQAQGDLVAFLDHDDLWHPRYLELQQKLFRKYPQAVAFFTDHVNFRGYADFDWRVVPADFECETELIYPLDFLERYHRVPLPFSSASFVCIPKPVLAEIEGGPFCAQVSGADDFHLLHILPLMGPLVFAPTSLAAYRITDEASSSNRLELTARAVRAMELVEKRYLMLSDKELSRLFSLLFASKRREYARVLMGVGKTLEAREQLRSSFHNSSNASSRLKSLIWLIVTYLPNYFQPTWPKPYRVHPNNSGQRSQ
jgi:glycosyltransferase involved in cell wall biosynthesis